MKSNSLYKLLNRRMFIRRLNNWRLKHLSESQYMIILSIPTGLLAGLAAVIIKNLTHFIKDIVTKGSTDEYSNVLYFVYPAIGIFLTIIFLKWIVKKKAGHGIPGLLYAISRKRGIVKANKMYVSMISSALTVGFGGSVGLEGPSVSTGSAVGSNIGQFLRLNYKQLTMMISMGGAAALAAIFQAPITGIVFAIEVLMIDLSITALVPLIISAFVGVLTSYFLLGQAVEYVIDIPEAFIPSNTIYYILLGVFLGLVSAYFMKVMFTTEKFFDKLGAWWKRFLVGSLVLGLLIFLFPSLYGEGYDAINSALKGDFSPLYNNSIFYAFKDNIWAIFALFVGVILMKAFATSFTFGAGGVGGTFAPSLFTGAFAGLFFALIINYFDIANLNPTKFSLVGMGGMVAGILHAPLTGIFLIAEITNGYSLIVPLMIVSTIAFLINRVFFQHSVYTHAVAEQGALLTHNKDRSILNMMNVGPLVETNFNIIRPEKELKDLIPIISGSTRNIFPVVSEDGEFKGHVLLDHVRSVMFDTSLYDTPIENLMVVPEYIIDPNETMEEVAKKFHVSGKYNIPVVQNGMYLGYISRANVFSTYRKKLSEISDD